MTTTNVETRAPDKMDYASPIQFRFKITKLPQVEFFIQTANIPGIALGATNQETPLKDIAGVGDKVTYQTLDISFLVDENLNNYKELHDWIIGLGFPKDYTQFQTMQATGADRFSGSTRSTAATGTNTPQPLSEGGIYSDATLTVLNSKNIAKTEVRFQNVFPVSLGALSFSVKPADVDYLTVNILFKFMNYSLVQISTT